MSEGTIFISSNVKEKEIIEYLLNCICSGMDTNQVMLFLALQGMVHQWKMDKVIYYINLIKGERK